jgi:hypothetical protein
MGENSFAFNSLTDRNFPKNSLIDELTFQLCTRPEKITGLSLKSRARDVKNSFCLPDIKFYLIFKF